MPRGKPSLISRRGAKSRVLRRANEAADLDLRELIRALIEARGDNPSFARGQKRFSTTLTAVKRVGVRDEIVELPEGTEVAVFEYLPANRRRWSTSSTKDLAVFIARGIAGHRDYQITVKMDGRARKRNLKPAD